MQKPRKPNLSLLREKRFSEVISGLRHRPHNDIINRIDSKMFSLDGNDLYRYKPEILAGDEYIRCLELFEKRLPSEYNLPTQHAVVKLQEQIQMIDKVMFNKEMKHIDELKQIAIQTVRTLFDIPEHVNILPEIERNLDVNPEEQDESTLNISSDRLADIMIEVRKREVLNGLVHGAAMHIWKSAYYIIKEQIDELDPMLMNLYDQYTTSIGWLLWQMSPDDMQDAINTEGAFTQGFCKLDFKEEGESECNVHCHAINFPVLLHEVTKGAIDYLTCRGIPSEFTSEELRYYYAKADNYANEIWHYLLSPTLWTRLVAASDVESQGLPLVISRLCMLTLEELTGILIACIDSVEIGRNKLKEKRII